MEQTTSMLDRAWQELQASLTMSNLQVFLLVGSGLLAMALMVLALTRWGQARPIWKCVVLSVGAHVLLMVYAYGTHLIFHAPPAPASLGVTSIQVVTEDGDEQEAASELLDNAPVSDSIVEAAGVISDEPPLERPTLSSPTESTEETAWQPEATPPVPTGESFEPPQPTRLAALPPELASPSARSLPVPVPPGFDATPLASDVPPLPVEPVESVAPSGRDAGPEDAASDALPADEADEAAPLDEVEASRPESEPEAPDSAADSVLPKQTSPAEFTPAPTAVEANAAPAESPVAPPAEPLPVSNESATAAPSTPPVASSTPASDNAAPPVGRTQRRPADGKPPPRPYQARQPNQRLALAKLRGGSELTEQAVESALAWLARSQAEDGRWDPRATGAGEERRVLGHNRQGAGANADSAMTALAVLALMAHGHTHLKESPYRENVQHGLEFLIRSQATNGDLAGNATFFARTYCHSMSLLAISEALAMTGDQRLLPSVQAGVNYSVRTQNQADGGWRYRAGDSGDMSQFGWKVLALHSAELGGVALSQTTKTNMRRFLDLCTRGTDKGLASYRPREAISTTMTAEALVCRQFLEGRISPRTRKEAARQILSELPQPDQINLYYWYYGTLAMYQTGGQDWETWNSSLTRVLLATQVAEGPEQGSWAPNGLWAGYGGRVYSTAMATLCLEVYYRYLPTHEMANGEKRDGLR